MHQRHKLTSLLTLSLLLMPAIAQAEGDAHQQERRARVQLTAGFGLPSLLHAEVGYLVAPRVTVEARYAHVIFNTMVGLGASGHLLGDAGPRGLPRHGLIVSGYAMVNPTLGELTIFGNGGELLGAALDLLVGYELVTRGGFTLRAQVGALLYHDNGFAGGPNFTLGLGYTF